MAGRRLIGLVRVQNEVQYSTVRVRTRSEVVIEQSRMINRYILYTILPMPSQIVLRKSLGRSTGPHAVLPTAA